VGFGDVLKREFSFVTDNYRILVVSWILMDLAFEMPTPNFQYYVQALGGTGVTLGIIGFANFLACMHLCYWRLLNPHDFDVSVRNWSIASYVHGDGACNRSCTSSE